MVLRGNEGPRRISAGAIRKKGVTKKGDKQDVAHLSRNTVTPGWAVDEGATPRFSLVQAVPLAP